MTLGEFKSLHGLSLKALASQLGFPVSTVSGWLTGTRKVKPDVLSRVAAATGGAVSPVELRPDLASLLAIRVSQCGQCASSAAAGVSPAPLCSNPA